jgi:hypothetical protein
MTSMYIGGLTVVYLAHKEMRKKDILNPLKYYVNHVIGLINVVFFSISKLCKERICVDNSKSKNEFKRVLNAIQA